MKLKIDYLHILKQMTPLIIAIITIVVFSVVLNLSIFSKGYYCNLTSEDNTPNLSDCPASEFIYNDSNRLDFKTLVTSNFIHNDTDHLTNNVKGFVRVNIMIIIMIFILEIVSSIKNCNFVNNKHIVILLITIYLLAMTLGRFVGRSTYLLLGKQPSLSYGFSGVVMAYFGFLIALIIQCYNILITILVKLTKNRWISYFISAMIIASLTVLLAISAIDTIFHNDMLTHYVSFIIGLAIGMIYFWKHSPLNTTSNKASYENTN